MIKKIVETLGKTKNKSFSDIVGGLTNMVDELESYETEKRQEVIDNDILIANIQADNEVATDESDKSAKVIEKSQLNFGFKII